MYVKYCPEDDLNEGRNVLLFTLKDPVVILINSCVDGSYIIICNDCTALPLLCHRVPTTIEIFILQWEELLYSSLFPMLSAIVSQLVSWRNRLKICDRVDFATELRINDN